MKPRWPFIFIALGVLLVIGGVVYDVVFVNIPPQDPPPEIAARYAEQVQIASTISWGGLAVLLLGSAASIVSYIRRRVLSSPSS